MKTILCIAVFLSLGLSCFAQNDTIKVSKVDTSFYSKIEERKGETLTFTDPWYKPEWRRDRHQTNSHKFKGHWAGIELGVNSYLNKNGGSNISGNNKYMDLITTRSLNFNINMFKLNYGLVSDRLGLVSGMGVEWYNYFFANKNSIMRDTAGIIVERTMPLGAHVEKSKLTNMFLSVPLLLELNFPGSDSHSRRLHVSISSSNSISHGRKVLRFIFPRSSSWIRRLNCANTASLSGRESFMTYRVVSHSECDFKGWISRRQEGGKTPANPGRFLSGL